MKNCKLSMMIGIMACTLFSQAARAEEPVSLGDVYAETLAQCKSQTEGSRDCEIASAIAAAILWIDQYL